MQMLGACFYSESATPTLSQLIKWPNLHIDELDRANGARARATLRADHEFEWFAQTLNWRLRLA